MKKMTLLVAAFVLAATAFAQKDKDGLKFSLGAELHFTSGNMSLTHNIGAGASAQLEVPVQNKLNAVGYGGILLINGKGTSGNGKNKGITLIPVRVGVKYFVLDGIYGAFQAGLGFFGGFDGWSGTAFSYSPQVGYEFRTKSGKPVDATFKYDGYSKRGGTVAFRLAKTF